MNVGILYPSSKAHPEVGAEFLNGMKAYLKKQALNNQIKFVSESIGIGGSEKEVYQKVEKMLLIDDVDVLVAYIDQKVLPVLTPLIQVSGKMVLIVNPGANYPLNWIPQNNVCTLTLQHAYLCWLTGAMAVRETNNTAVYTSTYYDCGYLHGAAMVKHFMKHKGTIMFNFINNTAYDESFDVTPLIDFLKGNIDVNHLLCIYDDLPAALLYEKLNEFSQDKDLHLFVSPMMLGDKALAGTEKGFGFSVKGYLPWKHTLENSSNKAFVDHYKELYAKEAGIFTLLGWETALILEQVFIHCNNKYNDGAGITGHLKSISFESPRGSMKIDESTHHFVAPAIRCSMEKNSTFLKEEIVGHNVADWMGFVNEPVSGVVSGWTNTYLCY